MKRSWVFYFLHVQTVTVFFIGGGFAFEWNGRERGEAGEWGVLPQRWYFGQRAKSKTVYEENIFWTVPHLNILGLWISQGMQYSFQPKQIDKLFTARQKWAERVFQIVIGKSQNVSRNKTTPTYNARHFGSWYIWRKMEICKECGSLNFAFLWSTSR